MKVLAISHSAVVPTYRAKFHALARLGCELHLVLPAAWPEGGRHVAAPSPGAEAGIALHVLPVRLAGHVGGFGLPGLGALIRGVRPELLHVEEEPRSVACWQALREAWRLGVPALFFTWENIRRRYRPPLNTLLRVNLGRAAWGFAGNHEAEQILRAQGFTGPINVIPQYGVEVDRFRLLPDARRTKTGKVFTIGYFGRLLEEKGISTLLHACSRLTFPFQLVLTGNGPYQQELRRQVRALQLSDQVRFQAALEHDQMPAALNGLDALVLPSETRPTWKEQFGRVLIEAMACEIPVVGSNSGEIPNVIGPGGLVFPEGDAEALAEILRRLRNDAALAKAQARRGRERVLAEFTTDRIVRRTFEVYQRMQSGSNECASR